MAKSDTFRFAIADTNPCSECWSVFTKGDDVYLTGSAYKNTLKLSLHGSGVCQVALLENFFAQHVKPREEAPEYRSILRWHRLPSQHGSGQVAATILFASFQFWPEAEPIPASKRYTALPPPPDRYAVMVDIIFSLDDPQEVARLGDWESALLFSTKLPNGEFVCLRHRMELLPADFFEPAPMPSPYAVSLGVPDDELDDARGISVLDCAQLFEGHGCIRSLHNMRVTRVARDEQ